MAKKAIEGMMELYDDLRRYDLIEGINVWHLNDRRESTVASSLARKFVDKGIVVESGNRSVWHEKTYKLTSKSIKTYSEWKKKTRESQK